MKCLLPAGLAFLFLILLAAAAGCSSPGPAPQKTMLPPATEATVKPAEGNPAAPAIATTAPAPDIADQLAAVKSTNPVWLEAYRMFRNMKSTEYVHTTYVDEDKGIYRFDCLGFVDYVLKNGAPAAFKTSARGYERPEMVVYADYFKKLQAGPNADGWSRVSRPMDLKPGDICLWQKQTSDSVGHMWIIAGTPRVNPERRDEVLVRIFDSDGVHGNDSRAAKSYQYGLGSGVLGMMVDSAGNPTGLYWIGGNLSSPALPDPTIVCGRYNR